MVANDLLAKLRSVRGLVDARIQQPGDEPAINVNVDRTKAMQAGLTQRDVAQNLLIALSGSSQTTPNFWLDPKNGVSYPLMTEVPQYDIHSLQTLANMPLTTGATISVAAEPAGLARHDVARHAASRGLALQRAARARYLRVQHKGATSAAWRATCRSSSIQARGASCPPVRRS